MLAFPITLTSSPEAAGQRLDQYLATQLSEVSHAEVSRARVQQLSAKGEVLVNQTPAKAALRLKGDEQITITGRPHAPPLRAIPEEIARDIVYEDDDLAIVNKPAGMMVHAGAGATEDARNRGTLVNALLHHFQKLSAVGGDLRPGIVHRLARATSGLMVVAKNDESHRRLAIAVAVEQTPVGMHARDADSGSKFSAFGGARVGASKDEGVAQVLSPVAGGTGELARWPGKCPARRSSARTWSVTARRRSSAGLRAIMKKSPLMNSRIFLLLVAFHVLAGSLIGQTAPLASTPTAAQNAPEQTSIPPDRKTQAPAAPAPPSPAPATPTPAAPAPAGPAPAPLGNPGYSPFRGCRSDV